MSKIGPCQPVQLVAGRQEAYDGRMINTLVKRVFPKSAFSLFAAGMFLLAACQSAQSAPTEHSADVSDVGVRLTETISKAESGDPEAQYKLGEMYLSGVVAGDKALLLKSARKAEDWFLKSAAGDYEKGYYGVACAIYSSGRPDRYGEALTFMRTAANRGNITAMAEVAKYHSNGAGTQKDSELTLRWVFRAMQASFALSEQDSFLTQHELGNIMVALISDRCGPSVSLGELPSSGLRFPGGPKDPILSPFQK